MHSKTAPAAGPWWSYCWRNAPKSQVNAEETSSNQAYVQTYVQLAEKIDLRCMHDDDLQQISHTCPTQDQHGLLACLLPEYSTRSKGELVAAA